MDIENRKSGFESEEKYSTAFRTFSVARAYMQGFHGN